MLVARRPLFLSYSKLLYFVQTFLHFTPFPGGLVDSQPRLTLSTGSTRATACARNLLLGKFRAREPGVRSDPDAPIILPANSGRNIVAGTAPTASLAIATHRLLKAWRQLVRLFSSLRLFSRRKAPLPGTILRRQKPAQKIPIGKEIRPRSAEDHCRTASAVLFFFQCAFFSLQIILRRSFGYARVK